MHLFLHVPMRRSSPPPMSFTVPPLQGDTSLTSFPLLLSRLHPAAYTKCLQAAETLPSSLCGVKFPPSSVSSSYLTSPHFSSPRSLIDDTAALRNYTSHCSRAYVAVKTFQALSPGQHFVEKRQDAVSVVAHT